VRILFGDELQVRGGGITAFKSILFLGFTIRDESLQKFVSQIWLAKPGQKKIN
jgi:hypothetical protein